MSTAAFSEIARNHQLESWSNIRGRPAELPGERPHGYAGYRLDGCRCYVCGLARAAYDDHRNKMIAYGRWQPFTSLTGAQAQIRTLREAGYGDRSIAALAGVNRKIIRDIRLGVRHDPSRDNPPLTKIRTETEAAFLAVPLDRSNLPGGATVDATTTWTQIHALIALCYPRAWIAAQIGHGRTLQLGRQRLTVRNAKAVHQLYCQVGDRPVLDPFAGSGTTIEACITEHLCCIAVERDPDYLPLITARVTKPIAVGLDFEESP